MNHDPRNHGDQGGCYPTRGREVFSDLSVTIFTLALQNTIAFIVRGYRVFPNLTVTPWLIISR